MNRERKTAGNVNKPVKCLLPCWWHIEKDCSVCHLSCQQVSCCSTPVSKQHNHSQYLFELKDIFPVNYNLQCSVSQLNYFISAKENMSTARLTSAWLWLELIM